MATDWLARLLGDLSDRPIDLEEVLRRIVDETTHRLDADRGTLYLVDHAAEGEVIHDQTAPRIERYVGKGAGGGYRDVPEVHAKLSYSRFWGNFDKKADLSVRS